MNTLVSNCLYHVSSPGVVKLASCLHTAWFLSVVWLSSDAGIGLGDFILIFLSGCLLASVWLMQFVARWITRPDDAAVRWQLVKFHPILLCLAVIACLTGAPFYVRFLITESALTDHAIRLKQPFRSDNVCRAGLFMLRESEARDGVVRFITCEAGLADHAGFVFSPGGKPPHIGEDYYTHISGPWWHWSRSW